MDDDLPPWPEHLLASNHPTRAWRSRSETTWEAVRQDYLAGAAARDLCDRYDVALSTLRLKAKEGGWRRADQADSDLFPADADRWVQDDVPDAGLAADNESWVDLAERARFRLRRAIASGRAAEAAAWLRVHDRLRALAAAEAAPLKRPADSGPPPAPLPDPIEAVIARSRQIESIAHRAARVTDEADIDALQAEFDALEARAAALTVGTGEPDPDETLDSLDSLDPVFSDPSEAPPLPDRPALLRTRERRLELGLGVSDLDQALADLDRAWAGSSLSP